MNEANPPRFQVTSPPGNSPVWSPRVIAAIALLSRQLYSSPTSEIPLKVPPHKFVLADTPGVVPILIRGDHGSHLTVAAMAGRMPPLRQDIDPTTLTRRKTVGALPMAMFVSLATTSLNPVEAVAVDEVDLIEINHYFDDKGRHVLDQIIFYDWSAQQSRYQVRDWRMLKRPTQIPYRDWRSRTYVAVWHDPHDGEVLRQVIAKAFRETWTQYDPEIVERDYLPKEKRKKLLKFIKRSVASETSVAEPVSPSSQVRSAGNAPVQSSRVTR